jgi:hypothetical protein
MDRLEEYKERWMYCRIIPLHLNQSAYHASKSGEIALYNVVTSNEDVTKHMEVALGPFLTLEETSDITSLKAPENNGNSMALSTSGRNTMGVHNQRLSTQGVLSPSLWSLLVDKYLRGLSEGSYYTKEYTNDIATIMNGKFPVQTESCYTQLLE